MFLGEKVWATGTAAKRSFCKSPVNMLMEGTSPMVSSHRVIC